MAILDTWYLFKHQMRVALRQPIWVAINLVQPLIWLLLYGQLFKNMTLLPGFPTSSYLQFFAPGVVVMTALFGSAWSAMGLLHDLDFGIIEKQLVTPASRPAIMLGRVLQAATVASAQAVITLLIAWALGASLASGLWTALGTLVASGLLATTFSAIAHGLAVILRQEAPLIAMLNFVLMPLMFLSSAMMPSEFVPDWIAAAARFNPVNWCVNVVRTLVLDGFDWSIIGMELLGLTGLAALCVLLATAAFRAKSE